MARIQLGGAGGAPTNNVIRSLRSSAHGDHLIGMSCVPTDLVLADVDERHCVPFADDPAYPEALLGLLAQTKPDLLHVQNDLEVLAVSRLRTEIAALGVTLFLPAADTVELCVDKYRSYEVWRDAGVPVPESVLLESADDLRRFADRHDGEVWLRANVGGGGQGALPVDDIEFAVRWVERFRGWGTFMAARKLTARSVTWLSLWHDGELVVAQCRRRRSWGFGNRTLSGVTGITAVGETMSDPIVDDIAQRAIHAVDDRPNGLFGVDMTYDADSVPNLTEINIGRFFTTVHFFTAAGLNLPQIYADVALDGRMPDLRRQINPLDDGLVWVRGMDVLPVLTTAAEIDRLAAEGT